MQADEYFDYLTDVVDEFRELSGTMQWNISSGTKVSIWTYDFDNWTLSKGAVTNPTCTLKMADEDFVKFLTGKVDSEALYLGGKLIMEGDMDLAQQYGSTMNLLKEMDPKKMFKSKL